MFKTSFIYFFSAIILVAFSACNEPTPLGDDFIDDADLLNSVFTDTLSLEVTLQQRDSLNATSGISVLLGNLNDPVFGRSTANLYFQLAPNINNTFVTGVNYSIIDSTLVSLADSTYWEYEYTVSPEDVVILDSLMLSLDYSESTQPIYGDTLSNEIQTFNLFRIEEDLGNSINDSTSYFAESASFAVGENLGEFNVKFDATNNYFVTPDDTLGVYPQMRFRLPDALGQDFLETISNTEGNYFENDSTFVEQFKGIYIQAAESTTATANINLANSYMRLFYTAINEEADSLGVLSYDTSYQTVTMVAYDVENGANKRLYASQYLHDYSGTVIEEILGNDGKITDKGYLQGMVGLDVLVKIPYLENLGNIIVNKAELEITNIENTETLDTIFTPPTGLLSVLTNDTDNEIAGNADILVDNLLNISTDSITSQVLNQYKVYETFSTQKLVLEPGENNQFRIAVDDQRTFPNRLIFEGPQSEEYPIKLNLYYTPIE